MKKMLVFWFLLVGTCVLPMTCWGQTTVQKTTFPDDAPPDGALRQPFLFIRNLFSDPLFPAYYRGCRTVKEEGFLPDGVEYYLVPESVDVSKDHWKALDSIFVGVGEKQSPGQFYFSVFLTNSDARESEEKIDWEAKSKQWDAFIARHWPGVPLVRETDWKDALANYGSRGVMRIFYSYRVEDVSFYDVELDIRVADGLIGGLGGGGYGASLKQRKLTPAPVRSEVAEAVLARFKALRGKTLRDYKIVSYERDAAREYVKGKAKQIPGFMISLEVQGRNEAGELEMVNAEYFEESKKVDIVGSEIVDELEDDAEPAKPLTYVADGVPFWNADGKEMFFATTREAKDRPFWLRGAVTSVKSIARYRADQPSAPLELIRPVKPEATNQPDMDGYSLGVPSPSGKYLAMTTDGAPARLFILDMQSGAVHNPRKDWSRDPELAARIPPSARSRGIGWAIAGCAWLPDESGLLLALYKDRDVNFYLTTWQTGTPPEALHLNPVNVDEGDDILPCFSGDGQRLAWISKSTVAAQNPNEPDTESWKFVVGNYDDAKAKISSQQQMQTVITDGLSVDVPANPRSVAWDSKKQRWLVAGDGYLMWISRAGDALKTEKFASLAWQQKTLKPIAAAVSSDGRIAVTATLPEELALMDEENASVTTQIVFAWDGEHKEVELLYAPGQNNLKRFGFTEIPK